MEDPKRVVGEWLDRYELSAGADTEQVQAVKLEIDKMSPGQLERFAAWLEERHRCHEPTGGTSRAGHGIRGFGLQRAAAQSKRGINLPGLRFIRAGM